jgi:hypothetical protein
MPTRGSSSTIVTAAVPLAILAPLAFLRLTENVSSGSGIRSPVTGTRMDLLISFLAKVSFPDTAT